jgi:hypothetical protein
VGRGHTAKRVRNLAHLHGAFWGDRFGSYPRYAIAFVDLEGADAIAALARQS